MDFAWVTVRPGSIPGDLQQMKKLRSSTVADAHPAADPTAPRLAGAARGARDPTAGRWSRVRLLPLS